MHSSRTPNTAPTSDEMLEFAATVARDGGIGMIDAPTGSGKSSVVASLLSERRGRKIVIAVRTVSQLSTFIRELALIKKKRPELKDCLPCREKKHLPPRAVKGMSTGAVKVSRRSHLPLCASGPNVAPSFP